MLGVQEYLIAVALILFWMTSSTTKICLYELTHKIKRYKQLQRMSLREFCINIIKSPDTLVYKTTIHKKNYEPESQLSGDTHR